MLDKFLCKRIHKKEITIGDIFEAIFPTLALSGIVIAIIAWLNYEFSVSLGIPYFKSLFYLIVTFIATVIAVIIFGIVVSGFSNMLQKIISIKIATCPNVKPESAEKSQDQ